MPNPSSVTAQQINFEIGATSNTTTLQLSNNWVKNLASTFSTANSNIKMGDCRWGINFPGGYLYNNRQTTQSFTKTYDTDNILQINSYDQLALYTGGDIVQAAAYFELFSNGVMRLIGFDSQGGNYYVHITWLTSGLNSDYTANLNVISGAVTAGSSAINSDLALSTNRSWTVGTNQLLGSGGDQDETQTVTANLIIKSAGTTLIIRPVTLYAQATLGAL